MIFDRDTHHKFNIVSHERDCHERHLDDDGEQVGQAEAEDGPVDARVAERLRPQDGGDHERVADEAEDEVEGGQRPDDGGGLQGDTHRGNVCKGAIDAGGPLGYFHCGPRLQGHDEVATSRGNGGWRISAIPQTAAAMSIARVKKQTERWAWTGETEREGEGQRGAPMPPADRRR